MSSGPPTSTTGSRSRPQVRKKPNDDASYFGPTGGMSATAGVKRQATDKVEGESRNKRKRVEPITTSVAHGRKDIELEERTSMVIDLVFEAMFTAHIQ